MSTSFAPNFMVSDIDRSIRFFSNIGYKEANRMSLPDGKPVWARLSREGHDIFLEAAPPGLKLGSSVQYYLSVDDVQAEARRLREARVEFSGPSEKPYGMTEVAYRDPDGYDWLAGQRTTPR